MQVIHGVLQVHQAGLGNIGNWLSGGAGLGGGGLVTRKRVAMNQCMTGCAPLDLSQTDEISALEVAIPMFKLPQSGVWRTGVEYIAHWDPCISITVGAMHLLSQPAYLYEIRTYSAA